MIIELTNQDDTRLLLNTEQVLTMQRINHNGTPLTRVVMIAASNNYRPDIFVKENLNAIQGFIKLYDRKRNEDLASEIAEALITGYDYYRKSDRAKEL
mgnify:FL=1